MFLDIIIIWIILTAKNPYQWGVIIEGWFPVAWFYTPPSVAHRDPRPICQNHCKHNSPICKSMLPAHGAVESRPRRCDAANMSRAGSMMGQPHSSLTRIEPVFCVLFIGWVAFSQCTIHCHQAVLVGLRVLNCTSQYFPAAVAVTGLAVQPRTK